MRLTPTNLTETETKSQCKIETNADWSKKKSPDSTRWQKSGINLLHLWLLYFLLRCRLLSARIARFWVWELRVAWLIESWCLCSMWFVRLCALNAWRMLRFDLCMNERRRIWICEERFLCLFDEWLKPLFCECRISFIEIWIHLWNSPSNSHEIHGSCKWIKWLELVINLNSVS